MRNHRRSRCLGNFLSGMETINSEQQRKDDHALETSLVEWKHIGAALPDEPQLGLGNFLSGMETAGAGGWGAGPASLGNFLSGMETIFQCVRAISWKCLGNFLSGMETANSHTLFSSIMPPWKLP